MCNIIKKHVIQMNRIAEKFVIKFQTIKNAISPPADKST